MGGEVHRAQARRIRHRTILNEHQVPVVDRDDILAAGSQTMDPGDHELASYVTVIEVGDGAVPDELHAL